MKDARGTDVLITGAASGMGLLYAERAVREGAAVVRLWDRDATALQAAERQLAELAAALTDARAAGSPSTQLLGTVVDLSDAEALAEALAELGDHAPDILINNAGIVTGNAWFWQTRDGEADRILAVNTRAPMELTRAILPGMIVDAARPKRILNVASAAGTLANPRMSVYAASKWALYGWSDSVRLELQKAGHRHVRVTTFCPSYVSTGMFAGARGMTLTPVIRPEHAVDRAWRAMLRGRPLLLAPRAVNLAKLLRGILPVRAWDAVAGLMGVYSSMDRFTGRPEETR